MKRTWGALSHGATRGGKLTPEYRTWRAMRQRCTNPRHKSYHRYGGRGVTICARWWESFAAFLADMGERPSPAHSLDRIDNGRAYSPDNCRWATRTEQQRNLRTNRLLEIEGVSRPVAAWAERTGLSSGVILHRLKCGWEVGAAVFTPRKFTRIPKEG